jgi:hypothetical protein
MLSGLDFAVGLALIACVIGGVRGGLLLADAMNLTPGGSDAPASPDPIGFRAFAAALLIVHAATAAVLGYNAAIGQGMALALGLGWIAAAAVRFWSGRALGETPRGAVVELLTGVALALPAWMAMARLGGGAAI